MTASDAARPLRVGFIGLGSQGGGMARRAAQMGLPLTLWARRPEALAEFADTGATLAPSPAELGAHVDVVGLCVVNDDDVVAVTTRADGLLAGMPPGSCLVIHSTIRPETVTRIASLAADVGVSVIDAPVSGGGAKAAVGELVVMVGGSDADVERCRPYLETFGGEQVAHLGPLGAGLVAKLVNNTLYVAQLGLADQAIDAGAALGLDREALGRVLTWGSATSYSLELLTRIGSLETLAPLVGPLLRKDVDLFEELLRADGLASGGLGTSAEDALGLLGSGRAGSPADGVSPGLPD